MDSILRPVRESPFSARQRLQRWIWSAVDCFFCRPFPRAFFGWRRFILRVMGAVVDSDARLYGQAKIWAPWNLTMKEGSVMAEGVDCYNVAPVILGADAVVSQYAHLCTASHDISDPEFRLVSKAITIGSRAWIGSGAYVGMGVTIGEGAVVAARAVVVKDVEAWTVVGGNPAVVLKRREIRAAHQAREEKR